MSRIFAAGFMVVVWAGMLSLACQQSLLAWFSLLGITCYFLVAWKEGRRSNTDSAAPETRMSNQHTESGL